MSLQDREWPVMALVAGKSGRDKGEISDKTHITYTDL